MSNNIIVSFALLFGAVITLICSVYVLLMNRRKQTTKIAEEIDLDD